MCVLETEIETDPGPSFLHFFIFLIFALKIDTSSLKQKTEISVRWVGIFIVVNLHVIATTKEANLTPTQPIGH